MLLLPLPLWAGGLRLATYNADLSRAGPGLLLRNILRGAAQVDAAVQVIVHADADILLLTGFDWDHDAVALDAFAALLAENGRSYPHRLALRPNAGMATDLDLDGDGRSGQARDAQGFGRFAGQGGMAILSAYPFDTAAIVDHSAVLWRDLPQNLMPPAAAGVAQVQRLSSSGHWQVPVLLPEGIVPGNRLTLLAYHATPPVFDGPEDRNGRRNHDEAAFWLRLLDGALPSPAPAAPFVLLGDANLDPVDGDGRVAGIRALLADPRLQDPAPRGRHGRSEPAHKGDPALDTALYPQGPGGLRVDYVLPSAGLAVSGAGVLWPPTTDPLAQTLATASRHAPVWVDITLP